MNIIWQSFNGYVDRVDCRADLLVTGQCEVGLVDLDMFAARFDQAPKILMQQLAKVSEHTGRVTIVLVVRHRGEKMRSGHGDFYRLARERRRCLKLLNQSKVDRIRQEVCGEPMQISINWKSQSSI
jgi:hypothetical protein